MIFATNGLVVQAVLFEAFVIQIARIHRVEDAEPGESHGFGLFRHEAATRLGAG